MVKKEEIVKEEKKKVSKKAAATEKKHEVEIVDINGIPYYVDSLHNVYQHETIHLPNPPIIGRWEWIGGEESNTERKMKFIKNG